MLGSCIEQISGTTCGFDVNADIHINVCHPMYHTYFPRSSATYSERRCHFVMPEGYVCLELRDDYIHDPERSIAAHEFTPKELTMPGIRTRITKAMLYTPGTLTVDVMNIFMRDLPGDATLAIEVADIQIEYPKLRSPDAQNRLVATYWIGGKDA